MKTLKLVEVYNPMVHASREAAEAEYEALSAQDGCLGGGVEEHALGWLESQHKGRKFEYTATAFFAVPADMPLGTVRGMSASSRSRAKAFGVTVPRNVAA